MPEETTQAASSPAEVEDVFRGETPTLHEFNQYRDTGELPTRFKPAENAESAPADAQEETEESEDEESETESESETEEAQEPPQKGSGAEKRIKQLLAKTKELEAKLAGKQDVKTEPSPVPQYTRPKPTADDKKQDGSPKFDSYEDFVEELADWKAEQRLATAKREQEQQEAQTALQKQVDEARTRYDDVDEVIFPAAQAINEARIPQAVKEVFSQSDLFVDLCYVVGSDPDELKKFISLAQTNPRAAIGKVFEYERGIREELSNDGDDKGKKAPEKKTNAPKPPSPVGGASSRAFDVSDESLSPEEWMRKRNSDLAKRRG